MFNLPFVLVHFRFILNTLAAGILVKRSQVMLFLCLQLSNILQVIQSKIPPMMGMHMIDSKLLFLNASSIAPLLFPSLQQHGPLCCPLDTPVILLSQSFNAFLPPGWNSQSDSDSFKAHRVSTCQVVRCLLVGRILNIHRTSSLAISRLYRAISFQLGLH